MLLLEITVPKMLLIEMPDRSKWGVPVEVIARHRAAYYAGKFDGDIERSLAEDTLPLFDADDFEIRDWATGNMDWADVQPHAALVSPAPPTDYEAGWLNGKTHVAEMPS